MPKRRRRPSDDAVAEEAQPACSADGEACPLDAVRLAYESIDGYTIAREEKHAQRKAGVFLEGVQYGEVDPASFAVALQWASPSAGERFFDLGSGTGKAVLTAAALHDFRSASGFEILRPLHDAALRAHAACSGSLRCAAVRLVCADGFSAEPPWHEADVVFCTTTCFTDEMVERLEAGAAKLRRGARLIVTTRELSAAAGCTLLRRGKLSYGKGTLLFLVYQKS